MSPTRNLSNEPQHLAFEAVQRRLASCKSLTLPCQTPATPVSTAAGEESPAVLGDQRIDSQHDMFYLEEREIRYFWFDSLQARQRTSFVRKFPEPFPQQSETG